MGSHPKPELQFSEIAPQNTVQNQPLEAGDRVTVYEAIMDDAGGAKSPEVLAPEAKHIEKQIN
jgi:hypothetical protein